MNSSVFNHLHSSSKDWISSGLDFAQTNPRDLGEQVFSQFISAIAAKPAPLANIERLVARSGNELKSFYAGNEYGYQRGYEAGHARGLLFGFVGCIVVMALMNSNNKAS